ncbi:DUSP19 [Symbiodinium sp. CCMP2592]|nr:DUSP19 [Symbiodinium sp. CCMP2592]
MALGRLSEEQYRQYGTEIIPGFLFLTSQFEAKDPAFLKEHGITHLVSVAEESPPAVPLPGESLHLALRDSPRTDVLCHFDEVFAVIDAAKRFKKGRALMHCHAMKARTGALSS